MYKITTICVAKPTNISLIKFYGFTVKFIQLLVLTLQSKCEGKFK